MYAPYVISLQKPGAPGAGRRDRLGRHPPAGRPRRRHRRPRPPSSRPTASRSPSGTAATATTCGSPARNGGSLTPRHAHGPGTAEHPLVAEEHRADLLPRRHGRVALDPRRAARSGCRRRADRRADEDPLPGQDDRQARRGVRRDVRAELAGAVGELLRREVPRRRLGGGPRRSTGRSSSTSPCRRTCTRSSA